MVFLSKGDGLGAGLNIKINKSYYAIKMRKLTSLITHLRNPLTRGMNLIYFTLKDYIITNQLELSAINQVRVLIKRAQPYVLFSGGRDSLVVLDLVRRTARLAGKKVVVIHVDTTVTIPDNLKYVKRVCDLLSVKLEVVRPKESFSELSIRKGFPNVRARWCCYYLKLFPVRDYFRDKSSNRIVFDGTRSEESRLRRNTKILEWRDFMGCYLCHLIHGWTKEDVLKYLSRRHLPINPLYSMGFRRAAECWCGVYKSVEEFKLLRRHYPELFNRLLKLEASMRERGSYLFIHGKRIYLRDIANDSGV